MPEIIIRQPDSELCFMDGVRQTRKANGISRERLAERLGISSGMLSHYETGRSRVTLDVALSLSAFLEMPIDFLLREGQEHLDRIAKANRGVI